MPAKKAIVILHNKMLNIKVLRYYNVYYGGGVGGRELIVLEPRVALQTFLRTLLNLKAVAGVGGQG